MYFLRRFSLYISWSIALIATFGSLYFSEIKHWEPCTLCWYQRIALFPLVIILGIAAVKNDRLIGRYLFLQIAVGALFSLYQFLQESVPHLSFLAICDPKSSCTSNHFALFSLVPLPLLSFIAFLGILLFLVLAKKSS